jgi:hypothetical protein
LAERAASIFRVSRESQGKNKQKVFCLLLTFLFPRISFRPEDGGITFHQYIIKFFPDYTASPPNKLTQPVMLLIHILEVVGSNLGLDTDYPE